VAYKLLFLDETGNIDARTRAGMAVVVLLVGSNLQVKRVMRAARRRFPKELPARRVYKARDAPEAVTRFILERLATGDVEIVILRVGRRALRHFDGDRNELYAAVVEEAIGRAWEKHPTARPVLHQRYEKAELRNKITERLLRRARRLRIELAPEDVKHRRGSPSEPGLEVVDAVAWAYAQWRRRNKRLSYLYELVRDKTVIDDIFERE